VTLIGVIIICVAVRLSRETYAATSFSLGSVQIVCHRPDWQFGGKFRWHAYVLRLRDWLTTCLLCVNRERIGHVVVEAQHHRHLNVPLSVGKSSVIFRVLLPPNTCINARLTCDMFYQPVWMHLKEAIDINIVLQFNFCIMLAFCSVVKFKSMVDHFLLVTIGVSQGRCLFVSSLLRILLNCPSLTLTMASRALTVTAFRVSIVSGLFTCETPSLGTVYWRTSS
jgi:hypothetical protein